MKKYFVLAALLSLIGCRYNVFNPPHVEELDPIALFGTKGRILEGRLFKSTCESNAFGNMDSAKKTSLKNAAKTAQENGYDYFTIIDKTNSVKTNQIKYQSYQRATANTDISVHGNDGYVYGKAQTTAWIPKEESYETDFNTYSFVFLLLRENELDGWNNIYEVKKYL